MSNKFYIIKARHFNGVTVYVSADLDEYGCVNYFYISSKRSDAYIFSSYDFARYVINSFCNCSLLSSFALEQV